MKFIIGLIIVVGLSLGAYQFYEYYGKFKDKSEDQIDAAAPHVAAQQNVSGDQLSGLPDKLRPLLETAQRRGASGLRDFLETYGDKIQDPRKAWIQLDYIELLSQGSPGEARRIFHEVQGRVQADSPVYGRVKQLEKTYE